MNKKYFGSKTTRLEDCQKLGLPVPKFLSLPSSLSKRLFEDTTFREKTAETVAQDLSCKSYAVRSSALIEDSSLSSFAGQFETQLNVAPENLPQAIYAVLLQAFTYLKGDLESFSLLIQEYINSDYAGVIFTRSPLGNREMVIEYSSGSGEQVVGGTVRPKKVSFYSTQTLPEELHNLGITQARRKEFYALEKLYGFPQDIEWCIQGNQFYFLQTRPITTISPIQYKQILFLEENLPSARSFYFAKTELTEIASKPTPITNSLLQKIYASGGPIENVYKKHNIQYRNTDFLTSLGNELFVDKEKEIKSLLPGYTYFSSPDYSPKLKFDSQFFITLKNIFHLNTIKSQNLDDHFDQLKSIFKQNENTNIQENLQSFLTNYEHVFETNLYCGISLKKLEFSIKEENISCLEILNSSTFFLNDTKKYTLEVDSTEWKGNSLELGDESEFVHNQTIKEEKNSSVETWWNSLASWKQQQLKPRIQSFLLLNRFREYGRWIVVKQINEIRNLLLEIAQKNNFSDQKDIYFCNWDEIFGDKINESICKNKKQKYLDQQSFSFPNTITQKYTEQKTILHGVSAGQATGQLLTWEEIEHHTNPQKDIILYTKVLSPDLTKYFSKIKGIVSEEGGMLSHLAIVARENHIPVVVNFTPSQKIKITDTIYIDGAKSEITKVI